MPRWRQTSGFSRLNCAMDIQGTASKPRLSTSSTCSSLQKRHGVMKSRIFSRRSRKGRQSPWDPRSSTQARFSFRVGSAREPTVSGSAGAASASSFMDIGGFWSTLTSTMDPWTTGSPEAARSRLSTSQMAELAAATEAPNTTLEFETLRDRLDYLAQLDGAEDKDQPHSLSSYGKARVLEELVGGVEALDLREVWDAEDLHAALGRPLEADYEAVEVTVDGALGVELAPLGGAAVLKGGAAAAAKARRRGMVRSRPRARPRPRPRSRRGRRRPPPLPPPRARPGPRSPGGGPWTRRRGRI